MGTEPNETNKTNNTNERIAKLIASPLFPLATTGELKELSALMDSEFPRDGEAGRPCHSCNKPERILWTNGRWKVTTFQPTLNPVLLFLETVEHIDFEHLDEAMAAEFGVLTWRLEAAVRSLESVGRVHIHRWGDGSSHFHVWFQGRPAKQIEFYGWGNVLWSQLADPLPVDVIDANHSRVIAHFSDHFSAGNSLRKLPS